ncbi:MAG: LytTR family DNA-binding domain-containing protein [Ferruginibacter sp.]
MNAIIVDDNELARLTLSQLARQSPDVEINGEFENAPAAFNFLSHHKTDIVFLDIEMPEMSGLELTRSLGADRPLIIFTSSAKKYATEAFDLNVADYIVKPVTLPRFLQAINKANELLKSREEEVKPSADGFIFIRDSNIIRRLKFEEILYAEAMGDYVKLYTPQKYYAIHSTLKAVQEKLPPARFLRVHRSFIVAIDKIDFIQEGALIINGKPIPVADAYRAILNKRLNVL